MRFEPRSLMALASLSVALICGCAAFTPRAPIAGPAHALGIATRGDDCARSSSELVGEVEHPSASLPEDVRRGFACLSLRDTVARDSMVGCAPDPRDVFERPLP